MRVPIRKPGQYTHVKPDQHLTQDKFDELKNKVAQFYKNRPAAIEEVKRLALDGDFSENAAYQIAKGRLRGINQRILETEELLKRAVIIGHNRDCSRVRVGHTVTVKVNGKQKIYLILGSSETNPDQGVISHLSPIGAALLGRRAGESAKVKAREREIIYKIIKIE